jgi:methylated-DNA-[protein]-cysteine S-methyltransferase
MTNDSICETTLDTPVGTLRLRADDSGLTHVYLPGDDAPGGDDGPAPLPPAALTGSTEDGAHGEGREHLRAAVAQLSEYFAGRRTSFDLTLAPRGTAFQCSVWWALADIPYGRTVSYAELARAVGRPRAFRAVGQANGANPLPIVLPCHRVIASGGSIGGYGGGVDMKRSLLALESSVCRTAGAAAS